MTEIDDNEVHSELIIQNFRDRIVRVLDDFLLKTGEAFAASVASGVITSIDKRGLYNVIYSDLSKYPEPYKNLEKFPTIALNVIARLSVSRNVNVQSHLRQLSDSYTLFSFLHETPDVQKAIKKIFGHGIIWLDTTIILPLLVESFLAENDSNRRYTSAISSLIAADVKLRVTNGVIQELLNHIRISQSCSNHTPGTWKGRIPYLYHNYIQAGYSPSSFSSTAEHFRGHFRPEDDITDYLLSHYGIHVESLEEFAYKTDNDLKYATERLWREAHDERRNLLDDESLVETTEILIKHDVESYLGIIALRQNESNSELGYEHWWLTTDRVAWKIRDQLREELEKKFVSPLMSLDFLMNSLSFGPARSKLNRSHEKLLPVLLDLDFSMHSPVELIELADRIRRENEGSPEYLIKRKVRDACDEMKGKYGELTKAAAEKDTI
uniref:Uncharacterized protein n=1 Tax=Candidatus Kentrum sp. TUN TaxID=2126343 RepID=A0A451A9F8_9GAMM|nr:MAG: hypothetical protein BECKTUN1418D_GA0071000_11832 [Candidatus Kentron sp. TUN]